MDKALQRPTPLAYLVEAERLMEAKQFDEAEVVLDKASALDPNDPDTLVLRSRLVAVQGDTDAAIALMKTAMRLDPHYPAFNLSVLGHHYLRAGDAAKAIEFLVRAQSRNPVDWIPLIYLTVAYAQADRLEEAKRTAEALIERRKELGFLVTLAGSFYEWPIHGGAFGKMLRVGLLRAGIPDKARPEDLNLSPEYRLTETELRNSFKTEHRIKGRIPQGVWMIDWDTEGNGVHYWNGKQYVTSTYEIRGDMFTYQQSDGLELSCATYRSPKGTKANLDEFIQVCNSGVYPHAIFPLPETTR